MFMLYVSFGVLILFAGRPFTADEPLRESYIPVPAQLGGDVTFNIDGAMNSYCQTHVGLMVYCSNGTTMERIGQGFQDRIRGSCDHIKLKDVREEDFNRRFLCGNLDPGKHALYKYKIKATIAPPQTSVNGSKVNVSWKPADWQTGPILEYEVKWSCNGTALLMNEVTVAGTSTVLEGLPQGVNCTVSVAAVTSDGVEAWSEPKSVYLPPSGSSQNHTQPVEEGKPSSLLVVSLWSVGSLVSLAFLAFLVWCLWKRCGNSVSGPQPNAEQEENGYPLVAVDSAPSSA